MAAKTSASTAFNSYFYQQQQQHTQAKQQQQQMENANLFSYEQFSDFHPKMSKKIAQLTKVIYALNSKNDESEFVMANLQAKYEEEKEQIIAETNRRLDEFREKFAETNDQSKKIVSLESAIDQYQKQKEKALKDLEEFRLKTRQNEETLIETHKIELVELNRRLNELHEEAVKQSSLFESAYKKFEKEKSHVADELRAKHREEMEKLEEKYASNKDSLRLEKVKLAEKYDAEISRLRIEIEEAANKAAKEKLEYEQNLSKLKSFHERELDACKHNSSSEYLKIIESLKASLEAMKKEKQADESEFTARYNKKLEEIVSKEEEIKTLNETLLKYKSRLENSNNDVSLVNQKISSLEAEKLSLEAKITQLENDNQVSLKKIEGQSAKLLEKSNLISQLEATNMQNASAISDLERELKSARERVQSLEKERQSLEAQNNRLSDANSEVKLLREKIELLVNDGRSKAAEHEREVKSIREANEKMIERLKTDFQIEKQSLISSYESKLSTEKALFEEQLLSLKRDLTKDHNSEISKVLGDRSQLMAQLESLSQEHQSKMKQNEAEIASLKSKLEKALGELNEISTSYETLKEENSKTVVDLSHAKETVSKQNRQISELTIEIEQLRLLLESTSKESKLELKVELEKLNRDLEAKWKEIVRVECERIKEEIERAKEAERLAELDSLAGSKDEELRNLKSIWQAKTSELLSEISLLKKELSEKEVTSKALFESTKAKLELENLELREHLNRVNAEHKARLDKIQAEQSQEHRVLLENLRKENEAKIAELKMQHLEDLKAQTIAQKAALSSLKTTLENNKLIEIELVNEDNRKKFETFKMETEQKYYNDLDNLKQENELEIMSIRAELDKSRDQYKQKERETEIRLEDVHNEMRMKQKQIEKLSNELKETKMLMSTLREESELKQRELKQVKSEAANEMRNREVVLQQKRDEEIARLNAESHKQKQMLLVEFKQAQDLLKQKIVETEEELRQLHDRFLNRESRQEDLELIQVLRNNLAERDELIRKIQEEKKYFQMELVNRENNFNKMFNTAPNIGMINPLNANTKVKNKSFGGTSNSTKQAQITKLEPIPGGSPIHDLTLNPNKPLPKKFLS